MRSLMPDRVKRPALAGIALLLAASLAGCATKGGSDDERVGSFFVAPGKYRFYTCAHLTQTTMTLKKRERELESLIARAGEGAGGGMVSAIAYRPELLQVRGNLAEVRREEASKNCPPAAAVEAPPQATAAGVPARRKR
ncbi:unnamed protein product [Phaeothamnion confervicola]